MGSFTFNNGNFEIKNYERQKPFASFLPGISGFTGIPMWTFFVNRGQCITGFGVKDKHEPMMEFSPAAIAYKDVYTRGFRTFIKYKDGRLFEPFGQRHESQTMEVSMSGLKIIETREDFKVSVEYCNVPDEAFAGLVRKVSIENVSGAGLEFDCLDGLPEILPFGIKNEDYKSIGNLLRSWMDVENMNQQIPYFKLRASTEDEAEVKKIERGHFSMSWDGQGRILPVIVDMEKIFGQDTSLRSPEGFQVDGIDDVFSRANVTANKLPGHFSGGRIKLKAGQAYVLTSLFGHTDNIESINEWARDVDLKKFGENCCIKAKALIDNLTADIETQSGNPVFDQYCRQSYLDNLMRGGYPVQLGEDGEKSFYVYSRKHGDQERDYNFFSISPEFYSQGNGNFRDVNQNRRSDVFFNPEVGTHNIKLFFDLIQLDGYNPLVIEGQYFEMEEKKQNVILIELKYQGYKEEQLSSLSEVLKRTYSPGEIYNRLSASGTDENTVKKQFEKVMSESKGKYVARHGEGFWSDHWTYNLDLVESYLYMYPEKLTDLMLGDTAYKFYDSPYKVLSRKEKIKITENGIRQYDAVELDAEKLEALGRTETESHWVRTDFGQGETLKTNLMVKLISLVANKFSLLDPFGMGVEMEAGKPGWNDALNGLPGLFGSSMAEQVELHRMVKFLLKMRKRLLIEASKKELNTVLSVPVEVAEHWSGLMGTLNEHLSGKLEDLQYWDRVRSLLEDYRNKIRLGVSGKMTKVSLDGIFEDIELMESKLSKGLKTATDLGDDLLPTFITFDMNAKCPKEEWNDKPLSDCIEVKSFRPLPHFLEGPARQLKTMPEASGKVLHHLVKTSELYDDKIKMYKTSVPIDDESHEIGRIRAFTPGWFERESVFLHMEYKYLLALLQSGQYESFFNEAQNALIPFLDPEVYGRPTTENVSFIASSLNPDETQHGRGHVARLSGSTAEFIHMWTLMMVGSRPFVVENGQLSFRLDPKLPAWLFDEKGEITFTLCGKTKVTYKNTKGKNTYGEDAVKVVKMTAVDRNGVIIESGGTLLEQHAEAVRGGQMEHIEVILD